MGLIYAPEIHTIVAGETRNVAVNFAAELDGAEVLTGTPTVTEIETSDLTLASKKVNTEAISINYETAAIGTAVQFSVTGAQAGKTYRVLISVGTNATAAQTIKRGVRIKCVAAV